jgi:ERCC4-type nuclease
MKICIDSRERDMIEPFHKFIKAKKSNIITDYDIGTYDSGDVHSGDGLVGIERKAGDFVTSMESGRLEQQLTELKENFVFPFLFIEYDSFIAMIQDNLGYNPKALVGQLTSIAARFQISIHWTGNYRTIKPPLEPHPYFVPYTVRTIEKFYDGRTDQKKRTYTPIRRTASPQEVKLDIASRFPRVGRTKGLRLLEHFGCIKNITNASKEELKQVKGIGDGLATEIYEASN